ncbi:hypothetical protein K3495_g15977, partial [Podosphaera aphanis]
LIHSLPQNDAYWKIQGTHILTNHLSLEAATLHLQSCEDSSTDHNSAQANNVRNPGAGRGNRGGGRGRWKNNSRNSPYGRDKKGDNSKRGNNGKSRGKLERQHGKGLDNDQCMWCLKHGHHQRQCDDYKKHRKLSLEEIRQRENKTSSGYTARITSYHDSNDNILSYSSSSVALPCVTSQSFSASTKTHTIIDSGATEHFSGRRSDFRQLKRWQSPRTVTVANGKEVLCEGYGTIIINCQSYNLELRNVWFVPEFNNVRLVSVWRLNDHGIEVRFNEHTCHLWQDDKRLFSVSGSAGLFEIPDTNSISAAFNTKQTTPVPYQNPLEPPIRTEPTSSTKAISQNHTNESSEISKRTVSNDQSI